MSCSPLLGGGGAAWSVIAGVPGRQLPQPHGARARMPGGGGVGGGGGEQAAAGAAGRGSGLGRHALKSAIRHTHGLHALGQPAGAAGEPSVANNAALLRFW